MSFVTHLECALCGKHYPARTIQTVCEDDQRPLWVRYDLEAVGQAVSRDDLLTREPTLWRYRELLPVEQDEDVVTLGEGMSPLLPAHRLGETLGLRNLWVKDESQLPTGSFKARGLAVAVSMMKQFGIFRAAIPTAGNAGGALAAYGARAGMQIYVVMPEDTPEINLKESLAAGARVYQANGMIDQCGKVVREGKGPAEWFDVSTLKEPYRIEGKKTMGLELAEQFGWTLPDVILYPTGGGTGLIGMWKAFAEMAALGWLESAHRPRMIVCQSSGCAPMARAFAAGERFAERFEGAATIASGLRVPAAVGDFMILDAVRESGGAALTADEERLQEWMVQATASEGIAFCPEAAACVGVLEGMVERGEVAADERVVLFNTGALQKYPHTVPDTSVSIDLAQPVDYAAMLRGE